MNLDYTDRLEASAITAEQPQDGAQVLSLSQALETFEKWYIQHALTLTHGHKDRTARLLAINRRTLYSKLKKYQLG